MCTGFWVSFLFAKNIIEFFVVAGLGYIIFELTEKFIPCDGCKPKSIESFTIR